MQLSTKDKEAEFWRIVEDGEDVVEVSIATLRVTRVASVAAPRLLQLHT